MSDQRADATRDRSTAGPGHPGCAQRICVVVDAYSTGRFLPEELSKYGVKCIHVQSNPTVDDFHRRLHRSDNFADNIVHTGLVAETLHRLAPYDVRFVVPGTESGVVLADSLSDALQLPSNGVERSSARRDKHAMAAALGECGVSAIEGMVSASAHDIADWADDRGHWPLVLKPRESTGGDNVIVCTERRGVIAGTRRILASDNLMGEPNRTVLAQQFLSGTEYFVNTVSLQGRHHTAEIWRYHKRHVAGGGYIYDMEEPLPYHGDVQERLREYVSAVLSALQIGNGPAHSEVMLTHGGPVLIETGARLAGSILPRAVSRCFGTNHVELTVQALVQPDVFLASIGTPYTLRTNLRYVSLIVPKAGRLGSPRELHAIRSLPSFVDMHLVPAPGDPVVTTIDSRTSPGYVYLMHDCVHQLRQDYDVIRLLERSGLYDVT